MSTEIGQLLANTLSADHSTREDASQKLELGAKTDYRGYALALSTELANEQAQRDVRMAAGLALKNSLSAKEYNRKQEMAQRWISIDEQARNQVKQLSLLTLASQDLKAGAAAGQVIAAIAEIELPQGQWPDLIQLLLNNVTSTDNDRMKQSTLQALGYVCEATDPDVLTSQANQILTAVVQGARKEESNQEVRLAAINALYNSLEFIRDNFEREGERNYIMQVVCEATQSSDVRVQVASFECLVRIMQLYYDKMRFYMEKALFGLTVLGMKHVNVSVALQAVEFWSTVCDEEIELQEEAMEAAENGEQMDRSSYNFAQAALGEILPVLLSLLTKQEEDEDEDEWNISMASGTCLSLLAQTVRDIIVPPVIPFVEGNIRNADWRCREAAVMAFGSILEGPEEKLLASLVDQALPVLIEMMRDPVIQVKDTVAWTLGRVSDVLVDCIKPDVHLHGLITALVLGLQDNPRIVSNCCWSLMNLAEQLGSDGPDIENTPLSLFFDGIITALMQFTDRADNEANSRTSAYEAISTLVTHAAKDCFSTIEKLSVTSLDRLEATITMANQIIGVDERNAHFELQSNLLSVVTNCIRKLGKQIIPLADRTMTILLQLLNSASKQSTITEDTFLAVGALTTALEADFTRYLEAFVPFLFTALQNHEEHQLCAIAVGLIGDICRALGEGSLPYCDSFMQLLIADLQSPVLHRNVKPAILSCFGDIALAISGKFEAYLQLVMTVLQQAGEMRAEKDNYDMIDYLNQLHEGMVEAYVGIVQGLKAGEKVQLLVPYVQHIFSFLGGVYRDPYRSDAVTRSMIGLLGDLGEAFASGQIKLLFQEDWVNLCLRDGRTSRHYGPGTKEVARWAKEMVKRASQ